MKCIISVTGAVQGVGYRPFVLKKATEYCIKGYVKNLGASVEILAIGEDSDVESFIDALKNETPPGAFVLDVNFKDLDQYIDKDRALNTYDANRSTVYEDIDPSNFTIIESSEVEFSDLPIFLPDIGICDDCMKEMLDRNDRRYRYPLISCASCGPRISILNKLPYDRDTTTMEEFKMCQKCAAEYKNGRRTHAQTISCHECGPYMKLEYYDGADALYCDREKAVKAAVSLLENNEIIGLKGISGYQLIGRPNNEAAGKIRQIKGREKKPFAVMFSDIDSIKEYCECDEKEEELLKFSARPIVLLTKKKDFDYEVCKDSRYIGAFLPSSGIHRLLTDSIGPLIVTSANISDEPIIIDDGRFKNAFFNSGKVKGMLYHDRKINIPQDDSVVFVSEAVSQWNPAEYKTCFIRRSRGYAPLPVLTKNTNAAGTSVLAFGGDLKNTFSFGKSDRIIPSPYIGDLKDYDTLSNEKLLIERFFDMYSFEPDVLICDMHPLYQSTALAKNMSKKQNLPLFKIQHHHAHILSVMAENTLEKCIGVAFDGTGYGTDGNIWGGEVLICSGTSFTRAAHIKYVKLCGGDNAPKKASQVKECYDYATCKVASPIVKAALDNNIGTFFTSSAGRLFDAISSLLDVKHENTYEGECATSLEAKAWEYEESQKVNKDLQNDVINDILDVKIEFDDGKYIIDQLKLFNDIKELKEEGKYDTSTISYAFHMALAKAVTKVCELIRDDTGEKNVCLSGGVFLNRLLLRETVKLLSIKEFNVYTNEYVPAGDAGISLGQAYYGLLLDK